MPPKEFDGHDGSSLSEFFEEYEHYFSKRFDGTDQQMARELREFLAGKMKLVYEAAQGGTQGCFKLKPTLLNWYQNHKKSAKYLGKQKFNCAKLERMIH